MDPSFAKKRSQMVQRQIQARGIQDPRVLGAMGRVPRHHFLPKSLEAEAYEDYPLPIGQGQTISQPYIVALMTECLTPKQGQSILEIGSGCGYQTAVLLELGLHVFAIERLPELFLLAKQKLSTLLSLENSHPTALQRLHLLCADGSCGWPKPEDAKFLAEAKSWNYIPQPETGFERILVAAATQDTPQALFAALAEGGKMVLPLGKEHETQRLMLYTKNRGKIENRLITLVRFVPLRTS